MPSPSMTIESGVHLFVSSHREGTPPGLTGGLVGGGGVAGGGVAGGRVAGGGVAGRGGGVAGCWTGAPSEENRKDVMSYYGNLFV